MKKKKKKKERENKGDTFVSLSSLFGPSCQEHHVFYGTGLALFLSAFIDWFDTLRFAFTIFDVP